MLPAAAIAQEASRGVLVPFTLTGGVAGSERARASDPQAARMTAGFRSVFYPGLRVNREWFVYSAVQVSSEPFFYYETYYPERELELRVPQLYLGYSRQGEALTLSLRTGQLGSAFGSFPLRYDDTANPLLDQPGSYSYPVKLRPDQMPCGTADLVHQGSYPVYVEHYCGGSTEERNGMTPVTLYGVAGIELDAAWKRMDARVQITNSSPANPQSLSSSSQHLQWTLGGGYTLMQGFRVGMSAFRGPFLEDVVEDLLPAGSTVRDYPALGIGADIQWARGRWSLNAEWQRFEYNYPGFTSPPALDTGYVEIRTILSPRFYLAWRGSFTDYGRVTDEGGATAGSFLPDAQSYEVAVGYHLNRTQTIKAGYEWLEIAGGGSYGPGTDVFGIQFVTSIHALSKPF
jgi:hypothetical protein